MRRASRCSALRYRALALNGVLCALAGSYLVLAQNPSFIPQHDGRPRLHGAGRDDLRQVASGRRVAGPACCSAFSTRSAIRLQGAPLPLIGAVPVQAIQALPYVLTVVLLAGFIGRARAPQGLGVPYVKER